MVTWKDVFGGKSFEVPSADVDVLGVSFLSGEIEIDPDSVEVYEAGDVVEAHFRGVFVGDGVAGKDKKVKVTGEVKGYVITDAKNPTNWTHYEFEFLDRVRILLK